MLVKPVKINVPASALVNKETQYELGFGDSDIRFALTLETMKNKGTGWKWNTIEYQNIYNTNWIAVTYDTNIVKLYVNLTLVYSYNGVLAGENLYYTGSIYSSNHPLRLGTRDLDFDSVTDSFQKFYLYFLMIYNRPLQQEEVKYNIRNPYNPIRNGLILYVNPFSIVGNKVYDFSSENLIGRNYNTIVNIKTKVLFEYSTVV